MVVEDEKCDVVHLHNKSLKIIDFNVASVYKQQGEVHQMMTKTGFLKYRAPELLEDGPFGYSANVDSWSLGSCFFYMLTG